MIGTIVEIGCYLFLFLGAAHGFVAFYTRARAWHDLKQEIERLKYLQGNDLEGTGQRIDQVRERIAAVDGHLGLLINGAVIAIRKQSERIVALEQRVMELQRLAMTSPVGSVDRNQTGTGGPPITVKPSEDL